MKICEGCFGTLWPGLVVQAQLGKVLNVKKCSGSEKCDYCGFERRRIVFEVWYEG